MRSLLPFRRRHGRKSRGQSLVEFALILPVFLVFLAATLDLGRVFYANISLNNAAREGAFEGSKNPAAFGGGQACDASDAGRIVCRIEVESSNTSVVIADGDISATCNSGCASAAGSTITVNVSGTFQLVTPILSAIFGGQTIPLHSSATAQIEYCTTVCGSGVSTPPPPPGANFTGSPTTITAGGTVIFQDLSTGSPSDWTWDFGDGNASTLQNPTHVYDNPGTYTVKLTAINMSGTNVKTRNNYIVVTAPATPTPTVAPTPTPTPACVHPPNVVGQQPGTAQANLGNAGFLVLAYDDLTSGQKNKVQSQNPDATVCVAPGSTVTIHWRKP